MGTHGLELWRRRFAADRDPLERRRLAGQQQARQAAADLKERWPTIRQIWLHGSLLTPGFHKTPIWTCWWRACQPKRWSRRWPRQSAPAP